MKKNTRDLHVRLDSEDIGIIGKDSTATLDISDGEHLKGTFADFFKRKEEKIVNAVNRNYHIKVEKVAKIY